jgi:hypothetical protein
MVIIKKKANIFLTIILLFLIVINFFVYTKIENQQEISNCIFNFQKNAKKEYGYQATIKVKLTFYGSEQVSRIRKIYVYQDVEVEDSTGKSLGGSAFPAIYSIKKNGDRYVVDSVEEPSDGSDYEESIKKMFPRKIFKRLNSVVGFFSFRNKEYFVHKL